MCNYKEIMSRETPTENGNVKLTHEIKKVTAKQNAINTATQNIRNSSDKTESDTTDIRKLLVTSKTIKCWKMLSLTRKLNPTSFQQSSKNLTILPYIQEQMIQIIQARLKKIARWLLNIAMTCKTDTNSVLKSIIAPRSDKPNEKASKANSILRHECNARNMCFVDN